MTQIAINCTYTDIRGGGYGGDAWIAKIEGKCDKYGIKRKFCKSDKSDVSGSGRSGKIRFEVTEAGIYEFRNFCTGTTRNNCLSSGFIQLHTDGTTEYLTKQQVINLI